MSDPHALSHAPLATGGVLGVFAHPDDETLGAGTVLATAAAAGVPTTVVTATRGERGEVIPPELAHLATDPQSLAHEREHEIGRALRALGLTAHRFLDTQPGLEARRPTRFTDSGMAWIRPGLAGPGEEAGPDAFSGVAVEVAARLLAALLRQCRPQVVLTDEPGGGYGHPDHVHVHHVTMRAVELAADAPPVEDEDDPLDGLDPWFVPVLAWPVNAEERYRAALHWLEEMVEHDPQFGLRGDVLGASPADGDVPSRVVPLESVDLTLDIKPVLPVLAEALHAHRTQIQATRLLDRSRPEQRGLPLVGWFALSNGMLQPILGTAGLRLAPGRDLVSELTDPRTVDGLTRDRLAGTHGLDRLAAYLGGARV